MPYGFGTAHHNDILTELSAAIPARSGGAGRGFIQLALSPAHGGVELRGNKRAHYARETLAWLENVPDAHGGLYTDPLCPPTPGCYRLYGWMLPPGVPAAPCALVRG